MISISVTLRGCSDVASYCLLLPPTASYCLLLPPTASYCFPLLPTASYSLLLPATASYRILLVMDTRMTQKPFPTDTHDIAIKTGYDAK